MARTSQRDPRRDERGAGAAEYALLASLIAVFVFAAMAALGVNLGGLYGRSCDQVTAATAGVGC
jgi:Flp pilus assembly pilin Flp